MKRLKVKLDEPFEIIISNPKYLTKGKRFEIVQRLSISIKSIMIPEKRTELCTFETDIHKYDDAQYLD